MIVCSVHTRLKVYRDTFLYDRASPSVVGQGSGLDSWQSDYGAEVYRMLQKLGTQF